MIEIREITDDRAYRNALARVEALMIGNVAGWPGELDKLAEAVLAYENKKYPVESPSVIDAALFRAQQLGGVQLIVAVSENGAIGKDGGLPWHISDELKWFMRATTGKTVIMGKRTWESLPNKPLPYRVNIVLSNEPIEGAVTATSIEHALRLAPSRPIVIGGANVYEQAMPYVDTMFITEVDTVVEAPFTPFNFVLEMWERNVIADTHPQFTIVRYDRRKEYL